MRTSFLTLGGWSEDDYTDDIVWFNTTEGHGWNQTLTRFTIGQHAIVGNLLESELPIVSRKEKATAMFETGYPYIGLSESYYDKVAQILTKEVDGMECTKGFHWGICRVPETRCDRLNLDYNLTFKIGDYDFSIPLKNMAVYVN